MRDLRTLPLDLTPATRTAAQAVPVDPAGPADDPRKRGSICLQRYHRIVPIALIIPVEMQIRALQLGARIEEVPVRYRKRVGKSKISGTVTGVVKAGWWILYTIFRYAR